MDSYMQGGYNTQVVCHNVFVNWGVFLDWPIFLDGSFILNVVSPITDLLKKGVELWWKMFENIFKARDGIASKP